VGTALIYLVVLVVVAALFFVGASAVFGSGEQLAPVPTGATPTWLPDAAVGSSDVRAVRFQQAVRGYKMAEVDWVLDRLAGELDRCALERDDLRCRLVDLESAVAGAKQADVLGLVTASGMTPATSERHEHAQPSGTGVESATECHGSGDPA
jgi:DivIVA domain-containing protein